MKTNPQPTQHRWLRLVIITCLAIVSMPCLMAATSSLRFSENYQQKLKCSDVRQQCMVLNGDEYSAVFSIPITPGQAAAINQGTIIKVKLGKLRVDQKLGKKYKADTRTASIVTVAKSEVGKKVGKRTMDITVTDDRLVCEMKSKVIDLAGARWKPVIPSKSTLKKTGKYKLGFKASLQIGEDIYPFQVQGRGLVEKTTERGSDGAKYKLASLTYKGVGKRDVDLGPLPVVVTTGTNSPAGSATIGTAGGTIDLTSGPLAGVSIRIPASAMIADTEILVSSNDIQVTPRSGSFTGTAVNIETGEHNTFNEPIAVTIPYDASSGQVPVPYYVNDDGLLEPCQVVSVDRENGTMTFETFHASLFAWLWQELTNTEGHTAYTPADGFQIVNYGSVFNPGGECFGISAFAQWFYNSQGGGLFPKFMEDIPFGTGTVKGQNIIASRAHTSVSRLWNSYMPTVDLTYNLTGPEVYSTITNILDNTASPTVLYLNQNNQPLMQHAAHAVLAYDHVGAGTLLINDPNYPGAVKQGELTYEGSLSYNNYQKVSVIGNGSFKTEAFENILADANADFHGDGAALVNVTSHTADEHVTERTITLSGQIESGMALVDKLVIWLNGTTKFEQSVGTDGYFSVVVNLVVGENKFTFETTGTDLHGNRTSVLNSQLAPFVINLDSELAQVLVTLSWNTNDTDLDLYVVDPTGDFSSYYHRTTVDGGELDYDDTNGFGPEHWTLLGTDTVRWDEPYDVRIHYYSDHQYTEEVPTIATRWDINVLLYEGTDRAESYNFSGVLAYDNSSNRDHTAAGADWADVCTVVPVQATAAGAPAVPTMMAAPDGKPRLVIPMPSEAEMIRLKENPPPRQ